VPPAKRVHYLSLRYALSCHKRSNFGDASAGRLAYNLQNDLSSRVPVGNIKRGLVPVNGTLQLKGAIGSAISAKRL
jgi:hypothetical protein